MNVYRIQGLKFLAIIFVLWQVTPANNIPDSILTAAWSNALTRLKATMTYLGTSTSLFPRYAPASGNWSTVSASDWTSGFYPGCLWYAYQKTGDTTYRAAAQKWTASMESQKTNTGTHDIGMMLFSSFGNGYRLMQTASYKTVLITAARSLSTRYNNKVGTINSWDGIFSNPTANYNGHETIIDNMMNLELLLWVGQNSDSLRFDTIARRHAEVTMNCHIRPDSSTYHVVRFNTATGLDTSKETRQGYSNSSCWSRGQSWGIYGFTMVYRFSRDARFLMTARALADYYIRRLPSDYVPYWDFDVPGIPSTSIPRDAASAAVAASAMLELSTYVGAADSLKYRNAAVAILLSLCSSSYQAPSTQKSILAHATGSVPQNTEINVGLIYADYYFLEALIRYTKYSGTGTAVHYVSGRHIREQGVVLSGKQQTFDLLGRFRANGAINSAPGLVFTMGLNKGYGTVIKKNGAIECK